MPLNATVCYGYNCVQATALEDLSMQRMRILVTTMVYFVAGCSA